MWPHVLAAPPCKSGYGEHYSKPARRASWAGTVAIPECKPWLEYVRDAPTTLPIPCFEEPYSRVDERGAAVLLLG